MVIGTLGHVAHGKSTTVKALTGTKPTRHSREKIRGITIELGYSACKLYANDDLSVVAARGGDGPVTLTTQDGHVLTCKRYISFADCPGHDDLMAVMLGGATVMDAALLTVAADEPCPMPQTQEHLMAAEMMDLTNMILIQNKLDLVNHDQAWKHHQALREFVKGTIAQDAPIVPLSAALSVNMDHLIRQLLTLPHPPTKALAAKPLRVSLVRSFDVNKAGTPIKELKGGVVGGTLVEGTLRPGDMVDILPGMRNGTHNDGTWTPISCTIVSLKSETTPLDVALPGGLIGFGTDLDPSLASSNGLMGQWMVARGMHRDKVLQEGDFMFRCLKRSVEGKPCRIHKKDRLQIHVGARSLVASFVRTKVSNVYHVTFSEPIVLFSSTKLVASRDGRIIGIGTVVNPTTMFEFVDNSKKKK